MIDCLKCGTPTHNPKFCSRSCSAAYTNQQSPKRKAKNYCEDCGQTIRRDVKYCSNCRKSRPFVARQATDDISLSVAIYKRGHRSAAFALVRARARLVAKKLGWNKCQHCGYDIHVEISHRKAIASFSLDTLINTINHPSNLLALCPNCHWEYDHQVVHTGVEPVPLI